MLELKQQGKVRAIGVSNFEDEQLAELEAIGHVDSLQPHLSLIDRSAGQTLIPQAHAVGTGVIGYSPMESGLLTGKFSAERAAALPDDDWRKSSPAFVGPELGKNLMLVDALSAIADERKVSVAAVAVAWTLGWPGVSGAIVGARSPLQIDDWIAAGALELSGSELDTIARAVTDTGAGQGPVRPS
jgi:aryl-alcohol dehydrogenase-like predicted oxidoreductase